MNQPRLLGLPPTAWVAVVYVLLVCGVVAFVLMHPWPAAACPPGAFQTGNGYCYVPENTARAYGRSRAAQMTAAEKAAMAAARSVRVPTTGVPALDAALRSFQRSTEQEMWR